MRPSIATALLLLPAAALAQGTTTEVQKLTMTGGAGLDSFGRDVQLQGDTLLISAFADDNQGTATFFDRVGGTWVEGQKISAAAPDPGDRFGISAILLGDTAFLGANGDDDGATNGGAVYVFERTAGVWSETDKLLASDPADNDDFGFRIDAAGDLLLVGASGKDEGDQDAGSAYVFERSGGVWSETQKLAPPTPGFLAGFGWDVATNGSILVVGAASQDAIANDSGAAYVYRDVGGTWQLDQTLTAPDGGANEYFGWAIEAEGDIVAVSAYRHDLPLAVAGAVYVYRDNGTTLTFQQKLTPSTVQASDSFGWSVAIQGERIAVGAAAYPNGFGDGALYAFDFDGATWGETLRMLSSDTSDGFFAPNMGLSIDLDGSTVVGGAPWADGDATNAGGAYVFGMDSVVTYCTAKTSSAGCVSAISVADVSSHPVSGAADYSVLCTEVQGQTIGLLFGGPGGPASLPFAGGTLCVNGQIVRGPGMGSGGTSGGCDGSFTTIVNDGTAFPTGLDVGPGTSGYYQYWYRDPDNGAGVFGTALSNAIQLDFN